MYFHEGYHNGVKIFLNSHYVSSHIYESTRSTGYFIKYSDYNNKLEKYFVKISEQIRMQFKKLFYHNVGVVSVGFCVKHAINIKAT